MDRNYDNVIKSDNYSDERDYDIYLKNSEKLSNLLTMQEVELWKQLYDEKSRQMILADIIEYIFLARGFFFITERASTVNAKKIKRKLFIEIILRFVNLLMSYESMTVDYKIRIKFLESLVESIPEVKEENLYKDLFSFKGKVGLKKDSDANDKLNKYFDKMLPKTAGGLWHELLVYVFLLRNDLGYIIPLLLNQKFLSGSDSLVPPDFLIITRDKNIYGIEVGIKKEIQSGSFSLMTNIPTATIDTINSRCSDRCPICKKWILFCDEVIENYSDLDKDLSIKPEIKCLDKCTKFEKDDILQGKCPYTKYSRKAINNINHKFTDGLHYHYLCVLESLSKEERNNLIKIRDSTAIKTHYPYYAGLEMLFKK